MLRQMLNSTACLLCLALAFCCGSVRAAEPVEPLRIHAWVGYFPSWLVAGFTEETGIPVTQSFFADNNALYRAVTEETAFRRYDLITPSAEMAQRLIGEGLLLPVDKKIAPRAGAVDPWFLELAYDPGARYSVPLFWGVLGLCLDKAVLPPEVALRIKGYKDLWLPELKGLIMLPNDFRSLMSVMLLSLGYSVNDGNAGRLEEAYARLESLAPSVQIYDTVDQEESMARNNTGVGVVWARAFYGTGESERFSFIFPSEGSPAWIDTMAVPASAERPEQAFQFIDYVLRPEVLARLASEAGWAITVPEARERLDETVRNNPVLYPPLELRRSFEAELMLPGAADALEKRWRRLKLGFVE